MITKKKKFIAFGIGTLIPTASLASLMMPGTSVVQASVNYVQAVHAKIEHINYSLRSNYLGLKNLGPWMGYIKEAKDLNAKLPKGSSQEKYALRIKQAEDVINASARVNQVEKSMEQNSKTMKNVPQWEIYISLAKTDLTKIDISVFNKQKQELIERLAKCQSVIDKIKSENDSKPVDLNVNGEKISNKTYKGDVIISGSEITLSESVVSGDLYVKGKDNTIVNTEIKGKLIIESSSDGIVNLDNIKAAEIKINQ